MTVFAAALLVGPLLSAAPAARAVANPVLVEATSPSSSEWNRAVSAICPTGLSVYGGGAEIITDTGAPGNVMLNSASPNDSTLRRWVAQAFEVGGDFTGNWRLRVFAICGPPVPNLTARARAYENPATATSWGVAVWVVCSS